MPLTFDFINALVAHSIGINVATHTKFDGNRFINLVVIDPCV
jgi:hypothetical protein